MPEWGKLATFVPNKNLPIYNWFYYKEGFSRDLVLNIIKKFEMKGPVLDPFCGSGTTLLVCKELGIDCYGIEILPIAAFAARAKLKDYDVEKLKKLSNALKHEKFKKPDTRWIPKYIKKFFNPHTFDDIIFFKNIVEKMDEDVKDFFLIALINSTLKASYIYKNGSVLKVVKKPVPPFRKFFFRQIKKMIKDLEKIKFKHCRIFLEEGDARCMKLENNSINAVITSPPYLNKIEYTNIYKVEGFLFLGSEKKHGIRSYIGLDTKPKENPFPDVDLPPIAVAYFSDMKKVLSEISRVCKKNAKIAIVVGNGCFPDRVVESDFLISRIAEDMGFKIKKIYCLNKRWCTTERVRKIGIMRESLLIFEK